MSTLLEALAEEGFTPASPQPSLAEADQAYPCPIKACGAPVGRACTGLASNAWGERVVHFARRVRRALQEARMTDAERLAVRAFLHATTVAQVGRVRVRAARRASP